MKTLFEIAVAFQNAALTALTHRGFGVTIGKFHETRYDITITKEYYTEVVTCNVPTQDWGTLAPHKGIQVRYEIADNPHSRPRKITKNYKDTEPDYIRIVTRIADWIDLKIAYMKAIEVRDAQDNIVKNAQAAEFPLPSEYISEFKRTRTPSGSYYIEVDKQMTLDQASELLDILRSFPATEGNKFNFVIKGITDLETAKRVYGMINKK